MPLHERVGEIFLANETDEVQAAFSASLARFRVEDAGIFAPDGVTVRNELRAVLLVESPHTHEVGYHYPLAGDTGRYVRKVLDGEGNRLPDGPIGRFVYDGCLGGLHHDNHLPDFHLLGIMNVSRLPFQSEAYDCVSWEREGDDCRNHRRWRDYLECMEHIKDAPGVGNYEGLKYPDKDKRSKNGRGIGRLKDELNDLRDAIANDLIGRLEHLHGNYPDVLLVCCGGVAQKFYGRAANREPVITTLNTCDLPHPSMNGWQTLNCEERQCLRNIRDLLWPPQQE